MAQYKSASRNYSLCIQNIIITTEATTAKTRTTVTTTTATTSTTTAPENNKNYNY